MRLEDSIEFYNGDTLVAKVDSAMVPPKGAYISIRGQTWEVVRVTFALDYADNPVGKSMRANVDLKLAPHPTKDTP